MPFFVYIVECVDGTFYTGYTTNVAKRVAVHNGEGETASKRTAGARYTRSRRPVVLVYTEQCKSRSAAMKREYAIKELTRVEKLKLIKEQTLL